MNVHYWVLFSSRVRVRIRVRIIRFNVQFVSSYTHLFVLLSVVIVTLLQGPTETWPRHKQYRFG